MDAGRDLVLISQQNVATSNAWSFNVSVTFQGATPTGGSLGGSFSEGSRQYTDTPTTVIADERLDAYAGRNTVLAGAGMWSKTGKLKLDTGDLVFDNYVNRDTFVAVSGSVSAGVNRPWDASFSARYRNVQGLTFATLGAGDLNIRNRPRLDLSGLNRDVANMTRVTSSTSWAFAIPSLNLAKLQQDIQNSANYVNALTANVPQAVKEQGEQAVKQYHALLLRGATEAEARQLMATGEFQNMLRERRSWQAAVENGARSPQELARIAYLIAQGEEVYFDKTDQTYKIKTDCSSSGPSTVCGVDINKIRLDRQTVANFLAEQLKILAQRPDISDQERANAIYRCAMTWVLLGGEDSLGQLQLVSDRLRAGTGYALQIAMMEAVRQYRAISPNDQIDANKPPERLRTLMISAAMSELVSIRDRWNGGVAPYETASKEVRALLEVMVRSGATQQHKEQAVAILTQYASAGVHQTPYAELLNNVWRAQNPVTASVLDAVVGLAAGVGETVARQLGMRFAATVGAPRTILLREMSAAEANAQFLATRPGYQPPWKEGTTVREITSTMDEKFVRVYGGGGTDMIGGWIMRADDILGLTPQQIASKYSLPRVPSMVADVTVPVGTKMYTGTASEALGGLGEGRQFLLRSDIPMSAFTNARPLR
jgi:hypothetical protein